MTTLGSLFAGIGGFDLGFERAGFTTSWEVEIEDFPLRVLESRFPHAQRFKDIRNCGAHNLEPVDCITAGVPCQDVSIAGKRAGLAGERTGLFYEFARILRELRPAWFVFENVPGLLSSNRGRDFAEVLRVLMVECGYGVSWRVLNSRYFGVAQRRRRVFVAGRFGTPCPAEILFESTCGARDSAACRETRQEVAYALAASVRKTGDGHGNAWNTTYVAPALIRRMSGGTGNTQDRFVVTALRHARGGADDNAAQGGHLVSVSCSPPDTDGVRNFARLPPGMDSSELLPKGLDSARYRALGNAVTVSTAEWLARRIMTYMKENAK